MTWEDTVRRRKEGDPLMKGGNYKPVNITVKDLKCTNPKCQGRRIETTYGYAICLDCDHMWKRRR